MCEEEGQQKKMPEERYEPQLHKPASVKELQQISDDLNYECSQDQLQAITDTVNSSLGALKLLDLLSDPVPEVKYPRTPGYRPKPEHRFGNAWAWRCDIPGAPSGKLFGKSVAIKDNTAVAGVPMSNGSQLLQGYIPEYDATVVTRILDAGGRILGKASCDDFCLSTMGFSSVDGYIYNPDNPDYRVGGSSGGSAVLVASGQVDLATGGDQGGSICIPAAWTGTVGLKPTYGLVPYTGIVSIEPTVDHVGPIARNVTDCALLLEVIAGNDGLDDRQAPNIQVPEYSKLLEIDMAGKIIGLLQEGFETCTQETQTAVKEFLATVGQAGFVTKDVSVPLHLHAPNLSFVVTVQGSQSIFQNGSSAQFLQGFYPTTLEKAVRQGLQTSAELLAPGIKFYSMAGELVTRRYGNHYYCKARNITMELARQYEDALSCCDVIVMPTVPYTALKFPSRRQSEVDSLKVFPFELTVNVHALRLPPMTDPSVLTTTPSEYVFLSMRALIKVPTMPGICSLQLTLSVIWTVMTMFSVSAYLEESSGPLINTIATDLTGHPALSLPLGKLGDGGTDSLMIVGRKYDELTVLQVARALEKIIPARN